MREDVGVITSPAEEPRERKASFMARRPWVAVTLLMLIGILNLIDRGLPAILAEPIKHDLNLSDAALGLINGFGFLAVYAFASIPLAKVSDRGRYNLVVVLALAVWSGMTMIGGLVANGWQLAATRVGVALGEAGGTPAAHAFITRHIPQAKRTLALSVFSLNLPIGAMAGLVLGGIGGEILGWRTTFIVLGVVGLIVSGVAYFCFGVSPAETLRKSSDVPHAPITGLLRKRSLPAILLASSFVGMGGYTAMAFTPAYLMRTHGMSLSEAGISYGIAGGIGSTIGLLLIGWLSDRLAVRDSRWLIGTVVAMLILSLPFAIIAFRAADPTLAMIGLVVINTVSVSYAAPVYAALHRLSPLSLRARASALLLLSAAILGGVGPVLTGIVSDHLQVSLGDAALGTAMLLIPASFFAAAAIYSLSLISFARDLEPEEDRPVQSPAKTDIG